MLGTSEGSSYPSRKLWTKSPQTRFSGRGREQILYKVELRSLQESIDTTSSGGQLIFHMFGALAEFERNLVLERTQPGLIAARARGRKGGRKKVLDRKKRAHAVQLYHSREHTIPEICKLMGIARATLYAYVDEFADGK